MLDQFPIDWFTLFVFTIPGFFLVWSFRKGGDLEIRSDFEYLMLSIFGGILLVAGISYILPQEKFKEVLGNPFASALVFSLLAIVVGRAAGYFYKFIGSSNKTN